MKNTTLITGQSIGLIITSFFMLLAFGFVGNAVLANASVTNAQTASANLSVTDTEQALSSEENARAITLFREIKCPTCTAQSVAESDAEASKSLRVYIRDEIIAGKSNKEIRDALTERYGVAILLRPPVQGSTLLLWAAPWLFVIFGAIMWTLAHQKRKMS